MNELLQTMIAASVSGIVVATIFRRASPLPMRVQQTASDMRVILDSCALIDGRAVDLAKLGFLPQEIIVPEFILAELQMLADGNDSQKRERARYGLEVVQQLQSLAGSRVRICHKEPVADTIDDKLVALAISEKASLFTNDFNLNQVASIKGVQVLNINELAHALRPHVLPGENLSVTIVQIGSNRDQGVGYLDDGTMIVVDGAKHDIGKVVQAIVTRSHQTVAGKMIFAKKDAPTSQKASTQSRHPKTAAVTTAVQPVKRVFKNPQPQRQASEHKPMNPIRPPKRARQPRLGHKERAEKSLLDAIDTYNQ